MRGTAGGQGFPFGMMRMFWELVLVVAQSRECSEGTELCTLKWLKMIHFIYVIFNTNRINLKNSITI